MDSSIEKLAGAWFIICSDFPLWLKGDKQSPFFTYSILNKNGKTLLLDEVSYYKNGKLKFIRGYDVPDPENENSFSWQGKGLLFFLRNKWKLRLMNEKEGWAVLWFSKTIFTLEGVDIISRNKTMGPMILDQVKEQMMKDKILKDHVKKMILLK